MLICTKVQNNSDLDKKKGAVNTAPSKNRKKRKSKPNVVQNSVLETRLNLNKYYIAAFLKKQEAILRQKVKSALSGQKPLQFMSGNGILIHKKSERRRLA